MTKIKQLMYGLIPFFLVLTLAACQEGPMEDAGEDMDEAMEETEEGMEGMMEETEETMEETEEEVR